SASSSSWPGVRIVTATGSPPIRISSGSSTATPSRSRTPPGRRTTSTRATARSARTTTRRDLDEEVLHQRLVALPAEVAERAEHVELGHVARRAGLRDREGDGAVAVHRPPGAVLCDA